MVGFEELKAGGFGASGLRLGGLDPLPDGAGARLALRYLGLAPGVVSKWGVLCLLRLSFCLWFERETKRTTTQMCGPRKERRPTVDQGFSKDSSESWQSRKKGGSRCWTVLEVTRGSFNEGTWGSLKCPMSFLGEIYFWNMLAGALTGSWHAGTTE